MLRSEAVELVDQLADGFARSPGEDDEDGAIPSASQMKQCCVPRSAPTTTRDEYGPGRWSTSRPLFTGASAKTSSATPTSIEFMIPVSCLEPRGFDLKAQGRAAHPGSTSSDEGNLKGLDRPQITGRFNPSGSFSSRRNQVRCATLGFAIQPLRVKTATSVATRRPLPVSQSGRTCSVTARLPPSSGGDRAERLERLLHPARVRLRPALREFGESGRFLGSLLAFADDLHAEGALHRAAVVSERFEERLLRDVEPVGPEGGDAPAFHVVGAVAPTSGSYNRSWSCRSSS